MISVTRLKNGLTIVTEKISHIKTASLGIYVKAGSRYEKDDNHGVSHFIEHLFFKGTESRNSSVLADEIDSLGGIINAYADREITCFFAKILSEHLEKTIALFADILCNSKFSQEEIDKEKSIILHEISTVYEEPDEFLFEKFYSNIFRGHPLGKSVLGTPSSVMQMTREKICEYFNNFYIPERTIITASGDVDHGRLVSLVEAHFDCWGSRNYCERDDSYPLRHGSHSFTISKPVDQIHIVIGGPGYGHNSSKKYAVSLLNSLLGGGISSRLFRRLRDEEGLAYNVYSFFSMFSDSGVIGVYASTSKENYCKVFEKIKKELDCLKNGSISSEELRKAKEHLKSILYMSMESTEARMHLLGKSTIYLGKVLTFQDVIDNVNRVTLDDLVELASIAFDEKSMVKGVLTDEENPQTALNLP